MESVLRLRRSMAISAFFSEGNFGSSHSKWNGTGATRLFCDCINRPEPALPIAIDRPRADRDQFHVHMDKAERDTIHAFQLFDANGRACGDLLVPAVDANDGFENGLATRIRCGSGITYDKARVEGEATRQLVVDKRRRRHPRYIRPGGRRYIPFITSSRGAGRLLLLRACCPRRRRRRPARGDGW